MQNQCANSIREINVAELRQLLEQEENNPPLLIDVRQPQEYVQAHLPGALLIPLGQLEVPHPALADRARPTVVYCRSGKRSMAGAMILCGLGFTNIMSLKGGITGWPYETLSGPPKPVFTPEQATTVVEVLQEAMKREILAQSFYRNWSAGAEPGPLQGLLKELVSREQEHMEGIYQRYLSWCEKNGITPVEQEKFAAGESPQSAAEAADPSFSSREELLELAVAKEFEAYNYYKTSAEMILDEEVRGLLFDLSFEERNHAASLLELLV